MSNLNSRLRTVLKKLKKPQSGWLDVFPAVIGTADGTIATGQPGLIYVRNILNGQILQVQNSLTPNIFMLQVDVGRRVDQPNIWQVKGIRETFATPATGFGVGGTGGIPFHGSQHTFPKNDTVWVDRKQILPLTILVSDAAGIIVQVSGAVVRTQNGVALIETQTIDLSSYVPGAGDGAIYVSIETDADGVLSAHAGSLFATAAAGTVADVPVPDAGKYMLGFVLLQESMTALSNDDIRVIFPLETDYAGIDTGTQIHAASASAVTDSDEFGFWEEVSGLLKKITWANIKATLKTYFDTLYVTSVNGDTGAVVIDEIQGTFAFTGVCTTGSISTDQTDWNPTGLSSASILRVLSAADFNIYGLVGGSAGRILFIQNLGGGIVTFKSSGGGTAGNRFYSDTMLYPFESMIAQYDGTSVRWRSLTAISKTQADALYVALTGNQTIAGTKTFSSDVLVPDEAYDATAWNGSLEVPTKNAIRDKIESMSAGGGVWGSITGTLSSQTDLQTALDAKLDDSQLDTDGTLAANSDAKIASQKATKTYADSVSSNASVIAKVLTAFSAGAGTVSSTDSILSAFQKVVGNIALKLTANSPITGATKTKITYDVNGLVTSGADATTADIADSTNKRYVTDAQLTVIGNTSGTNSGNETATTIGALIGGAGDATPNDTDFVATSLTAGGILKKITWTNVKAFLKTYFDTLYTPVITTIPNNGWIASAAGTVTSGTLDSPSFELSFPADMTALIGVGYRIKLTQSTTKYFIVTKVGAFGGGATVITCYGGTDYTLVASGTTAISNVFYSPVKAPFGFPVDPDKWTVSASNTSNTHKTPPAASTWYGGSGLTGTGISVDVPIGVWKGFYKGVLETEDTTVTDYNVYSTLSNANNTESDANNTFFVALTVPSGTYKVWNVVSPPVTVNVTTKTTYYMNIKTSTSTADAIHIRGDVVATIIKLVCAYL